jgi:hypothetical protein
MIKLRLDLKEDYVCLNTSIEASLADKQFVLKRLSKAHIHLMISFLTVREIGVNVHETKKYVNFSIYLSSKDDKNMTEIHRKMHLVEDLKANMLIENDILESKEIIIDIQEKKVIISSCQNMIIEVKIHQKESFVRRNVINQFVSVISLDFYAKILYKIRDLSTNRNFLFESFSEVSVFIYAHVIDVKTIDVIVRNESEKSMKISRNFKLEVAQEIEYEDCFYISQEHHLILQISKRNSITEALKVGTAIDQRSRALAENSKVRVSVDNIDGKSEQKISFEVTVFEDDAKRQQFDKVINEFSDI